MHICISPVGLGLRLDLHVSFCNSMQAYVTACKLIPILTALMHICINGPGQSIRCVYPWNDGKGA